MSTSFFSEFSSSFFFFFLFIEILRRTSDISSFFYALDTLCLIMLQFLSCSVWALLPLANTRNQQLLFFFFFQCARINGKCFGTALAFKKIIIKSKNGWNLGMRNLLILSPYIGQDFTHFKHLSNAIARIDIKWKVKLKWVSLTYSSGLSSD